MISRSCSLAYHWGSAGPKIETARWVETIWLFLKISWQSNKKPFVRYKLCNGHLMRSGVGWNLRKGLWFRYWDLEEDLIFWWRKEPSVQCSSIFFESISCQYCILPVLHCLRSPNPNEAFEPWCLKDPIVACVPWWSLTHLGKLSIWIRHLRCKKRWVEEVKVLLTQVTSLIQILQWLDSKFWRLGLVKCINLSRTLKSKR